jgi:hypothetical protein
MNPTKTPSRFTTTTDARNHVSRTWGDWLSNSDLSPEQVDALCESLGERLWRGTMPLGDDGEILVSFMEAEVERLKSPWTYEGYWNAVIGDRRTAESTVAEFDLDPTDRRGLDEWLGLAEVESARAGRIEIPEEWSGFHAKALDELCTVER